MTVVNERTGVAHPTILTGPATSSILEQLVADFGDQGKFETATAPAHIERISDTGSIDSQIDAPKAARKILAESRGRRASAASDVVVTGMEKWEGRVISVEDGLFTAELTPLDDTGGPVVHADFNMSKIAPETVEAGDVVYVTVRTVRQRGGLTTTTSAIRLRRLGVWTSEELDGIRARAAKRAESVAKSFR
ncbi:hypothetical protein E1263_05155 [Kribbella antibiotica]|uniref:Uncharacterized protein n=1 Tax=Kribbella antibiotica TaxID=190195 RepID=A0A4R4ZUG3_9ACTN|nr:hypothetical protein [Kribbella antibiotica]TDD62006.1 hypothetical protein E1263_05155 [Kribbella antibiotica]